MRFDHRRGLNEGTEDTHPDDGEGSPGMVLERDTTPGDGGDTLEVPHPGDGEGSTVMVLERHMMPEKVFTPGDREDSAGVVLDEQDDPSAVGLDELGVLGSGVGDPASPDLRKLEHGRNFEDKITSVM